MTRADKVRSLADAVAAITDGSLIALGGGEGRHHPMAIVRELARQRKRRLRLVRFGDGVDTDLLVGAGCVHTLARACPAAHDRTLPALLQRHAGRGAVTVVDHDDAVVLARIRAAALGLAFLPLPADTPPGDPWAAPLADPFTGRPALAVAALRPDVALLHTHAADRDGNVYLDVPDPARRARDRMLARASRMVIVTVEQRVSREAMAACPADAVLPADTVSCVVEAPYGAYPTACDGRYVADDAALREHGHAAEDDAGFAGGLATALGEAADHGAFLDRVGARRLFAVTTRLAARG